MKPRLKYKRVLLKLSGEALGVQGISPQKLNEVVREVRALCRLGVELAIVMGGGNIWRKRDQGYGMDGKTADYLGLLGTVMNALALQQALQRAGVHVLTQLAVAVDVPIAAPFNKRTARAALNRGTIVIFGGGTGKPGFTTDTGAAQRAVEVAADIIIKAGPANGVYSADPRKVKQAKKFSTITVRQALRKRLGFMDRTALTMCAKAHMPIVVCRWGRGVVGRAVHGQRVGTLVVAS